MNRMDRKYYLPPWLCPAVMFLVLLFPAGPACAAENDPFAEPAAQVIELSANPAGGKWAYLEGEVSAAGENLLLEDLWITRPVQIAVRAEDKGDDILVELRRYHWAEPEQTCSTREGICTMRFKTQGDIWIRLVSEREGSRVLLAVWESEEILPELKPWFVPYGPGGR